MKKCGSRDILISSDAVSVFAKIIKVLHDNHYVDIQKVPLRKYPGSEHIHIYEKEYACLDKSRVFQISSDTESIIRETLNTDYLRMLYRCFFLNEAVPVKKIRDVFDENFISRIIAAGVAAPDDEHIRFLYRFVPDGDHITVSSAFDRSLPHFTYFSYDSFIFARLISEKYQRDDRCINILDFCSGSGYVGLSMQREKDVLVGIDINPNAIEIANLNASLHGKSSSIKYICDDKPPVNEKFDLIVCNPPYVFLPESNSDHIDSYGGSQYGTSKTLEFIHTLSHSLHDEGKCFMITRSPVIHNRDFLLDRLESDYHDLYGRYYDLCDASSEVEEWESSLGLEGYKHIFLFFQKAVDKKGWTVHQAKGKERFKYAF